MNQSPIIMFKKFSYLLTAFVLLAFLGSPLKMLGQSRDSETYTWVPREHYTGTTDLNNVAIAIGNGVEAMFSKSTGSTPPKYYAKTSSCNAGVRLYTNNTFTISPIGNATITEIKYTFYKNSNKNYLSARMTSFEGEYFDGGTPTSTDSVVDRWAGTTTKPVVVVYEGSAQRLLSKVEITVSTGTDQTWNVTYNSNNGSGETHDDPNNPYAHGATVTALPNSFSYPGHVFDKWTTAENGGVAYYPGNTFSIYSDMTLYAQWLDAGSGFIDVLNPTNVNEGMEVGSGYLPWSVTCATGDFTTTYKGKSYKNDDYIQFNSTVSTAAGVVTGVSHGKATKVEVLWDNNTISGRTLLVYGRNYPYSATSELYAAATQGTLIGSIVMGSSTELNITDEYEYIGLRSASGALYMDEIRITWAPSTEDPIILFSPATIDLGNVVLGTECSATFIVSQANLGGSINLSSQVGLNVAGNLDPSSIPNEANPTSVTWTYTPTAAGIMNANINATSTWIDDDGQHYYNATLPITATVLDPNQGISLSSAKSRFIESGTTSAVINLQGVEVIGQYGNFLYLQDASAGLLVYGQGAPEFVTGDKFTAGSLTGNFANYNGIVQFTDFVFQDVQYTSNNALTPCVVNSVSGLVNDNNHTYEHRYVQINGLTISVNDFVWTLNGNTSLAMTDRFGTNYANCTAPETNDRFTVKGLFNPYSASGILLKELAPTQLSDISTTMKAANPTFSPVGGLTSENPVSTTTVVITPSNHTTLNYSYERNNRLISNGPVTLNLVGATTIHAYATRDFYAPSDDITYYYTLPEGTATVTFSINGDASNFVYVLNQLQNDQCPVVSPIGDFTFRGWSTEPSSTTTISLPYSINGNTVLYAVYGKAEAYSYNLLSSGTELGEGEYVIVGDDGRDQFVLKNSASAYTPTAYTLAALNLTYHNGVLEGEGLSEVTWTVANVSPTSVTVTSTANGKYLYTVNSAQGVRVGDTEQTWLMAEDDRLTGRFNLRSDDTQRYLSLYNGLDWRCYLVGDMYNLNCHPGLLLFKKTPLGASTDARFTRIFVNEDAAAEIVINGPSVIPSGSFLNMGIHSFECDNAAWFVIEDGASFVPAAGNSYTMKATVQKAITGYGTDLDVKNGWYLLSSPVGEIRIVNGAQSTEVPGYVNNLTNGEFDLYWFDQTANAEEWRNYKANNNSITFGDGVGVLYASQTDKTVSFVGSIYSSVTSGTLRSSGDGDFKGMNLVGNPFTASAYITGSSLSDFFKLVENEEVSELQSVPSTTPIDALEGVFVYTETDGEEYNFTLGNRQQNLGGNRGGVVNIELLGSKGSVIDQTRLRFGQGGMQCKLMLNANGTNLCIPMGSREYAVVRAQAEGEMPINFKAAKNGNYTLKVETSDLDVEYLHLIDHKTGADIDLLATPSYSFEAKATDYASRFKIVFETNSDNTDIDAESFAYYDGSDWVINNMGEATLQVVDMLGRIVNSTAINGNVTMSIDNLSAGVYVMRLVNGNNVKVQKVVVK